MADVRLIDVNAAIERAKESDKIVGSSIWETCEVVEFLEDCPIEDAVPVVHGEWLDGYATQNGKVVYKSIDCSVCEEYFKIESYDREYWKARFKVCPFCGAKMDLEVPDGQA